MIVTTRDIVIPAGTELQDPPIQSTRWGKHLEAVIGVDADRCGYFSIDLHEALESGLVEKVESPINHEFVGFDANPTICRVCGAVKPMPCFMVNEQGVAQ